MPTYNVTFSNWSDVAQSGSVSGWTSPGNAQVEDNNPASIAVFATGYSDFLVGQYPSTTSFAVHETLTSIVISIWRKTPSPSPVGEAQDQHLYLVSGGTIITAVDHAATSTVWPTGTGSGNYSQATYTFSTADLATLGITTANITSTFGVALSAYCTSGFNLYGDVDQIAATFYTNVYYLEAPPPTTFLPGIGLGTF